MATTAPEAHVQSHIKAQDLASGRRPSAEVDLARLLSRLERTLITNPEPALRRSTFERSKVGVNLDHAQTMLLRLEHETTSQRQRSNRSQPQSLALREHRALLKQLQTRLAELNRIYADDDADNSDQDSDSDEEDLLARYAPARPSADAGIDIQHRTPAMSASQATTTAAAATLSSTLRSRGQQSRAQDTGSTTGRAGAQAPQATNMTPFAPSASRTANAPSTQDALMEHHEKEQDALTSSLLTLASALKESSKSFASALVDGSPLVDQASASLDKSVGGMEAASARMGTLRRMTEGKGWWARLRLWGMIAGLWFLALCVVVFLPKLRI